MIPSRWPDMELWAVTYLRPLIPDVKFETVAGDKLPAKHVLVSAIPGQRVTPITQLVRLDFEVRCTRDGNPWPFESNRVAQDIAFHVESAPRNGDPVVYAEKDTGPQRVVGDIHQSGFADDTEFVEMTIVLEVQRL